MSKVIRDVKVDWSWSGDSYSLRGFNIAITPTNGDPKSKAIALYTLKDNVRSYVFHNIILEDTLQYTAWVQAIYDGKDSDWINTSNFAIADDGSATVETKNSNIANYWRSSSDPSKMDGGDIYAGSVTADKINAYGLNILNLDNGNLPSFSVSSRGEVALSGNLKSFNYSATDKVGWSISQDGNAELNQATVRGSILLPNAGMTDQNNIRIWAGSANPYSSWTTTISSASSVGAKTLTLTSVNGIIVGVNQLIKIGTEQKMIINVSGKVVTLDSALINAYSSGTTVTLTLLAPFAVSQDGNVYASKGNFGGSFIGTLDVGNIHITDSDPNSSPTGASFLMNTDGESRTVIRLQEESGFIDTRFAFGNDTDKYIDIDNVKNNINVNNNSLNLTQFSRNLLTNSTWLKDTTGWNLTSSVTRDTATLYNGYYTVKSVQSGNATNVYRGIENSTTISALAGDVFTFSIYTMSNDISLLDVGASMEIRYWNASGTRITQTATSIKPSANNTWQRFTVTGTCPANTVRVTVVAYVTRNGALSMALPQLETGNIMTAWGVHSTEVENVIFPNRIDRHYVEFDSDKFNFDIKDDDQFYFQSNSPAPYDFVFRNESVDNNIRVIVDGELMVNKSVVLGKLQMVKKTDSGNNGIDFIFV